MTPISRFFGHIRAKPGLIFYLLALVSAAALSLHFLPIGELLSGVLSLTDADAVSSVFHLARWLVAEDMVVNAFVFIFAAPAPLAVLGVILFAGAFGSFAGGAETAAGFPAKAGIGFLYGYKKRSFNIFAITYAAAACVFLLVFVWLIAAIPLAVIERLYERGSLPAAAYYMSLIATSLAAYFGFLFIRAFSFAFLPSMYSGSYRPVADAFSFAGAGFFRLARAFVAADVLFACGAAAYFILERNLYALIFLCVLTSALIYFIAFTAFNEFAADGYGFDEIDETDGMGEYNETGGTDELEETDGMGERPDPSDMLYVDEDAPDENSWNRIN